MESYIPPSVIKFDGLSFDEGDYSVDSNGNITSLERINNGLRLGFIEQEITNHSSKVVLGRS
ncbi:hypothetical protein ONA22_02260 [Mycoplasmopsis cynos]|uniref:hypothetical protein n=1 Tax=Mycoplasmopsis cynos TaxID=171284 RepID=UPI0024C5EBCC|nr:hypothetical protein [Mycoplasmopsis cynos]WAM03828.1 hypothetical protein ONA22_02260 [Mycoplasmopsis cynos]